MLALATAVLLAGTAQMGDAPAPGLAFTPFTEVAGTREFSGELIVRFRPSPDGRARKLALGLLGNAPVRHVAETDEYIAEVAVGPFRPGVAENAVAVQLLASGLCEYACPNWIVYPLATPNDPEFARQWHHAAMQSEPAWSIHRAQGAQEIIVAVTDTGMAVHQDLLNRVPGYNSRDDVAEADGAEMLDMNGHGTHVAGCVAASGDNGIGVSGMGWNLRIMPIRVSNSPSGGAVYSDVLRGVRWAAEHGAKVISASYAGVEYPPVETTGEYVRSLDASMLWAAGNGAADHAAWDFEHVVVIGASDQADRRAAFSSFGRGVDLFAPGVSILSTTRNGSYGFMSGTSMATPIANGALALIRSANPALSAAHAEYILFNSCDFWDGVANSESHGWGRINLRRAVELALAAQLPQAPVARDDRARAIAGTAVELDVLANDFDANMDALAIQSWSATTSAGHAVTRVKGGAGGRDVLRIADIGASAGVQTLSYTLVEPRSGATSAAVATIDVAVARRPVRPVGAGRGLDAKYYALTKPVKLPDFSTRTGASSGVAASIQFPFGAGGFAGSGRATEVGAVFTGWIEVPATGFWTLDLTSDEGSRLWIGDDLVVDHDGLHGMTTASGTRALAAGKHPLRVEYFNAFGGGGLLMTWSGPGRSTEFVPPTALFNGGSVEPADLDADGVVNSQDLAALLNAWGARGSPADLNDDGTVGAPDLATLLSRWTG